MTQPTLPRGMTLLRRIESRSLDELERAVAACPADKLRTTERVDQLNALGQGLLVIDPSRALEMGAEAAALAEELVYGDGKATAQAITGYALYILSRHHEALGYLFAALTYFEKVENFELVGLLKAGLASVETSLGNYAAALAHAFEALKLARAYGSGAEEAWVLHGLGTGYSDVGDYATALEYLDESLSAFTALGEKVGEARARTSIGTVLQKLERYQQALPFHENSLALFREMDNKLGEARALNDLGTAYQALGDYDRAADLHKESLGIREAIGNRQSVSTSLINLGKLCTVAGDPEGAIGYLDQALALAEELHLKPRIYQAHEALAVVYEQQANFSKALYHYKAFHLMHEAVLGDETSARMKTLEVQHEVSQAEREAQLEREQREFAESKNQELRHLLDELKSTQAQLIQTEKMASLGQLTAGIAHEIKNPLNFINNFASLSVELTEELAEEIDKAQADAHDLLQDLRFNAKKIAEHGERADRIVRSMMLHARGKPEDRHSIDLNELLDEYIGLAYHGMRAQQPMFNVVLTKDFDVAVGKIPAVPQELGRVVLNLLNNAFYAVHEQANRKDETFRPRVTIRSRRYENHVEIRVADNGGGIPEAIRQSIFEPFFTTKPTGSGTGLGLSLSYDIITQGHSGTLRVESTVGEGSVFIIELPG